MGCRVTPPRTARWVVTARGTSHRAVLGWCWAGLGDIVTPPHSARCRPVTMCASPRRNAKRFRGGLVFKAHRWLYHSTLGSRVMKKKKKVHTAQGFGFGVESYPPTYSSRCRPWGLGCGVGCGETTGYEPLGFGVESYPPTYSSLPTSAMEDHHRALGIFLR